MVPGHKLGDKSKTARIQIVDGQYKARKQLEDTNEAASRKVEEGQEDV